MKFFLLTIGISFHLAAYATVEARGKTIANRSNECDQEMKHYQSLNNCERLKFLCKNYGTKAKRKRKNAICFTRIIGDVEKFTGIEASCNKGTFGCFYFTNSNDFQTDIKKWKEATKCE